MGAEYDQIARQYRRSKALPFRTHVEAPLLSRMLGDLGGLSVLDLACGEGHYTRRLRQHGAGRVVGVDLSEGMIALAREQEAREPLGIAYLQGNAEGLGPVGEFDLVTASYLLNYARSPEALLGMARTVASNLRPGGRFVSINSHIGPGPAPDLRRYDWAVEPPSVAEWQVYRLTFFLGPDTFSIENVCHTPHTLESALRSAGFGPVFWHPPEVDEAGLRDFEPGHWDAFVSSQPIIGLECRLGAE
jgi:SAM-dependent methyltransferase